MSPHVLKQFLAAHLWDKHIWTLLTALLAQQITRLRVWLHFTYKKSTCSNILFGGEFAFERCKTYLHLIDREKYPWGEQQTINVNCPWVSHEEELSSPLAQLYEMHMLDYQDSLLNFAADAQSQQPQSTILQYCRDSNLRCRPQKDWWTASLAY